MTGEDSRVARARDVIAYKAFGDPEGVITDLLAAYDELWTWDGLLAILDKHYPEDIFPTSPDREDRDLGPRIVSLIRYVEHWSATAKAAEAERDQARAEVERLNEVITRHGWCDPGGMPIRECVGWVCDCPQEWIAAERDRLRAAVQPASDYVNSKNYTTLFGDGGANDVRLVLRDLGFAQAEVERLRAERDSLRAAVQRVRAMAEDWGQRANSGVITGDYGHDTATASAYYHGSGDLLLALDGPTEDTEPSDRGSS